MTELPKSLDEAIAQAKVSTQTALSDGYTRLQVELLFPEIALQAQAIAQAFVPIFADYGSGLRILFPDSGAAALARRDWGETPFQVSDLGTVRSPIASKVQPEDTAFLVVSPSAVEVGQVEKLFEVAGDRPCVLLNPQLEDVSIVGIGYAARQLRDRLISTITSCYYLRPLEGAAILRPYPSLWQVWLETDNDYQLIAEEPQRPVGEVLERILTSATSTSDGETLPVKKTGFLTTLRGFLKALSR